MLQVINTAALTTPVAIPAGGGAVPFDTTVYSTNGAIDLKDNAILLKTPAMYHTTCEVVLKNAGDAAVTVSLQALANGKTVNGATSTETIAASATRTIVLDWAERVIPAESGTASISWTVSGGAVSLSAARAQAWRMV